MSELELSLWRQSMLGRRVAELEARNASLLAQVRTTVQALLDSHGAHGSCKSNNCKDCRRAYSHGARLLEGFAMKQYKAFELLDGAEWAHTRAEPPVSVYLREDVLEQVRKVREECERRAERSMRAVGDSRVRDGEASAYREAARLLEGIK